MGEASLAFVYDSLTRFYHLQLRNFSSSSHLNRCFGWGHARSSKPESLGPIIDVLDVVVKDQICEEHLQLV